MKPLMELLKSFFIQRFILYCIIAFFSFFVVVPMGDLRLKFTDDHCSRCILYSSLEVVNVTTSVVNNQQQQQSSCQLRVLFGEQEVCEYNLAVSSVFCLIYPLVVGAIYLYLHRRDSHETREENKLDLSHFLFLVHVVLEVAMTFLVLVSAGMISAGFMHICDSVDSSLFGSCSDTQDCDNWSGYDGSNFYVSLAVATAGSWFLFVSWLLQALLGLWKLWRLNMLPAFSQACGCLPCVEDE